MSEPPRPLRRGITALAAFALGVATADGAPVVQWTCGAGRANQQWTGS